MIVDNISLLLEVGVVKFWLELKVLFLQENIFNIGGLLEIWSFGAWFLISLFLQESLQLLRTLDVKTIICGVILQTVIFSFLYSLYCNLKSL